MTLVRDFPIPQKSVYSSCFAVLIKHEDSVSSKRNFFGSTLALFSPISVTTDLYEAYH